MVNLLIAILGWIVVFATDAAEYVLRKIKNAMKYFFFLIIILFSCAKEEDFCPVISQECTVYTFASAVRCDGRDWDVTYTNEVFDVKNECSMADLVSSVEDIDALPGIPYQYITCVRK